MNEYTHAAVFFTLLSISLFSSGYRDQFESNKAVHCGKETFVSMIGGVLLLVRTVVHNSSFWTTLLVVRPLL